MPGKTFRSGAAPLILGVVCFALLAGFSVAWAAQPATATPLLQAVTRGKQIFNQDKFGGARTCSSCHINSGATQGALPGGAKIPSLVGVASDFPKYKSRAHRVITLQQQLRRCIKGGLQGTPPAAESPQMTDLITYLTWLSKGSVMGKQFK